MKWVTVLKFTIKYALTKSNFRKLKASFLVSLTHLFRILYFYIPWGIYKWVNPIQPNIAFHIETSHLICFVNQMIGFYMKCITGRKWVDYNRSSGRTQSACFYNRSLLYCYYKDACESIFLSNNLWYRAVLNQYCFPLTSVQSLQLCNPFFVQITLTSRWIYDALLLVFKKQKSQQKKMWLRILTGIMHPKIKLKRLRKVWIRTFEKLVHHDVIMVQYVIHYDVIYDRPENQSFSSRLNESNTMYLWW